MNEIHLLAGIFAGVILVATTGMLLTRNIFHIATFLLLVLLGIAAMFVLALADFLGIVQIVVYIGGVLMLILFGIMFTTVRGNKATLITPTYQQLPALLLCVLVFGGLSWLGLQAVQGIETTPAQASFPQKATTLGQTGILLLTDYLLPFELAGLLLLAALVGATFVAAKKAP